MIDHQLFRVHWFYIRTGTGVSGYGNKNGFSDPVGNENEMNGNYVARIWGHGCIVYIAAHVWLQAELEEAHEQMEEKESELEESGIDVQSPLVVMITEDDKHINDEYAIQCWIS